MTNSVVYLKYPVHTQIYEYQMGVVVGLYWVLRAAQRHGKRFFFRGGGLVLKIPSEIFGEFMLEHQS